LALFVKIVVFKTKLFKVDWSGSARLLREQREGKSTTTHYLVNSNKVCENSLKFRLKASIMQFPFVFKDYFMLY